MAQIQVGDHMLEVMNTFWGREIVKYDGSVMIKGFSWFGRSYMFYARDDGDDVVYEGEFTPGMLRAHYIVRQNGIAVFTT